MKKLILTALTVTTVLSLANATGFCRVGKANLTCIDQSKGLYKLECIGDNGVCYETDDNGNTGSGAHIVIKTENGDINATIQSGSSNNLGNTQPGVPTDKLPSSLIIENK